MFLAVSNCFENNTGDESLHQVAIFCCGTVIRGTRLKGRLVYVIASTPIRVHRYEFGSSALNLQITFAQLL